MVRPRDLRAQEKRARLLAALQYLASKLDIRPYAGGGHHIYLRGTKIRLGRLKSGAAELARSLIVISERPPPRRYMMTGKWRGMKVRGRYIPAAERRARMMQSTSLPAPDIPPRDPAINDVADVEVAGKGGSAAMCDALGALAEPTADRPSRPGGPGPKEG